MPVVSVQVAQYRTRVGRNVIEATLTAVCKAVVPLPSATIAPREVQAAPRGGDA
jgi:hypothetical protein